MRNEMNRENMMRNCRSALGFLAGVDNRTMQEVAQMSMRSAGASAEMSAEVVSRLAGERSAASEDFSF
ncbi:MAG: hypothetical protein IJ109_03230 [Firmicutes bacterium]|nr:hypothetical protein [Bacillota bacterium]